MPTPRLCGEVPGAVPAASARGGRAGGAVLRPRARAEDGRRRCCATLRRARAGPCGPRGGGTKPWGAAGDGDVGSRPAGSTRILEHNVGDFTAVLEAGVPLAEAQAAFAGQRPDARARPARPTDGATIGGIVATARLRPAAPPLRRRRATSSSASTVALSRRHARQGRRQGDQERRRLRPRRSCSPARSGRSALIATRRRAAAPAARARPRPSSARATTRTRSRRAALALARAAARGRLPRRRLARTAPGALLVRFGGAPRPTQARGARRGCASRARGRRGRSRTTTSCGTRQRARQRAPTARC